MKNKKFLVIGAVALVIIGFIVATKLYRQSVEDPSAAVAQDLLVRPHAITLGRAGAKVIMVEFYDPECESCRQFDPYTKELLKEFAGRLQIVFRYAPFHANSRLAIKMLEAARKQNRYWETLEVFFANQHEWGSHHAPRPELLWTYLPGVGVDPTQLKVDMVDPAITQLIDQDVADGQQLGINGTPTFYVNGEPLLSFGPDQLRELIVKHIEN